MGVGILAIKVANSHPDHYALYGEPVEQSGNPLMSPVAACNGPEADLD